MNNILPYSNIKSQIVEKKKIEQFERFHKKGILEKKISLKKMLIHLNCYAPNLGIVVEVSFYKLFYLMQF